MQVGRRRAGHDGFVETDDPALAPFLEQPGEDLRGHLAFGAAEPAEVPARAPVHEQAARDVDAQHRHGTAVRARKLPLEEVGIERGSHRVVADFTDPAFDDVQIIERNASNPAGSVVHPEDHRAAPAVRQGGQFVREGITLRVPDAAAGYENALALERRVLAETDAAKQVLVGHRVFPESNAA